MLIVGPPFARPIGRTPRYERAEARLRLGYGARWFIAEVG